MTTELDDTSAMPFGKYKGILMQDVPVNYLHWLWTQNRKGEMDTPVIDYIRRNIDSLQQENSDLIW